MDFLAKNTWKGWWKEYDVSKLKIQKTIADVHAAWVEGMRGSGKSELGARFLRADIKLPPIPEFEIVEAKQFRHSLEASIAKISRTGLKVVVIADTQCKPTESLAYMSWIGRYIDDKRPDIIVHIGDHYDFPSLSSYDKGKKSFEGRRLKDDINAGNMGMELLLAEFTDSSYKPRMIFCMGNHEDRFNRLANDMPELDGFVGTDTLPLKDMGWEVYPFLKPVEIEGIYFVHYLANPMTGKPYAGSALNQLKTVGKSFVVGHKQTLDFAVRPTIDGKMQIGIVNGACYPFDEGYKGYQGNNHFRGITMLHEVKDGFGLPMLVSLEYLRGKYEQ
jgi:hypothetical protein